MNNRKIAGIFFILGMGAALTYLFLRFAPFLIALAFKGVYLVLMLTVLVVFIYLSIKALKYFFK